MTPEPCAIPELRTSRMKRVATLALALLIPLLFLALARLVSVKDGCENTNDAYYHVSMAERGPSAILAKRFPWLFMSVWNETYADKELGYHLLLSGVLKAESAVGVDVSTPPFHFAGLLFCAVALGAFIFAAARLGVSPGITLAASTLLCVLIPNFTYRFLMLRPHTLSIAFMLAVCGVLAKGSLRWRVASVFAMSFAFAWCYSNPHFILFPPAVFAVVLFPSLGWKALALPGAALAGVVAGLVAHPQFPNSLLIWKVQSWDALISPLVAGMPVGKPAEMDAPSIKWLLYAAPLFVLAYLDAMLMMKLCERKGFNSLSIPLKAMGLLAALSLAGIFLVIRAVEYACPFLCLFSAALMQESLDSRDASGCPTFSMSAKKSMLLALACILLSTLLIASFVDARKGSSISPPRGVAAWLSCNAPEGARVVNPNWSDFPQLFYAAPSCSFAWGMDPMFSYVHDPKRTVALEGMKNSRILMSPNELGTLFGSSYLVLLETNKRLAVHMMIQGWTPLYEGSDGWIFPLYDIKK